MQSKGLLRLGVLLGAMLASLCGHAIEQEDYARWYFSPNVGVAVFEGDQPLQEGFFTDLKLGYDLSEWWSFEGGWLLAPSLDENFVGRTYINESGQVIKDRISYADKDAAGFDSTWMSVFYADALFHFTRWERLDPFLSGGIAFTLYGEDVLESGRGYDFNLRGGGGAMWHIDDEWAIRGDSRLLMTTDSWEFNWLNEVGVVWTWGAAVPPDILAADGPVDSDGDGLADDHEGRIGTDPYDPDTDKDGLTDGQEVNTYKTDPLNPDTDYDQLKDGAEVNTHKTDPLDRDTDDGGVYDGHEVNEDNTNPLVGADDLFMRELRIQFDYDKAELKPQYFAELNTIVKVMRRHSEATAVIEGHADQLRRSKQDYNRRLSERRAQSVVDYIASKGVAKNRMRAVGYGFSRPKAKPDLVNGTPENRRVELYIGGVDRQQVMETLRAE